MIIVPGREKDGQSPKRKFRCYAVDDELAKGRGRGEMSIHIDRINTVMVLMPDGHIGNLVVSLPAIDALLNHFQDKELYLVIDAAHKEIVETVIDLEHTKFYPRNEVNRGSFLKRTLLYIKFIEDIRQTRPDTVIDLDGGHTSSMITLLSGALSRVARSSATRPYAYNVKVTLPEGKHKVYDYTKIAEAAGAVINEKPYRLSSSGARRASLQNKLKSAGVEPGKRMVCIHPGAGRLQKLWTVSGFAVISDWLAAKEYQVVFIGGPGELDRAHEIISLLQNQAYNLAGGLSLGELMAFFEMSSLFLGNDSGPMHLAAAMGTPVIALFGYGDENRWGPRCEQSVVLRGQERCEECIKKACQDPVCISTLSPAAVKAAIKRLLRSDQISQPV